MTGACKVFAQSGERRNKGNSKEKERRDEKDTNSTKFQKRIYTHDKYKIVDLSFFIEV
jgi:hypothetical protein